MPWVENVEAEIGTWHCRKVKDTVNGCELPAQAQSAPGAVAQSQRPECCATAAQPQDRGTCQPQGSMEQDTLKLWSSRIKHKIFFFWGGERKSFQKQSREENGIIQPLPLQLPLQMVWSWERTLFLIPCSIPSSSSRLLHRMPPVALLEGTLGYIRVPNFCMHGKI